MPALVWRDYRHWPPDREPSTRWAGQDPAHLRATYRGLRPILQRLTQTGHPIILKCNYFPPSPPSSGWEKDGGVTARPPVPRPSPALSHSHRPSLNHSQLTRYLMHNQPPTRTTHRLASLPESWPWICGPTHAKKKKKPTNLHEHPFKPIENRFLYLLLNCKRNSSPVIGADVRTHNPSCSIINQEKAVAHSCSLVLPCT